MVALDVQVLAGSADTDPTKRKSAWCSQRGEEHTANNLPFKRSLPVVMLGIHKAEKPDPQAFPGHHCVLS